MAEDPTPGNGQAQVLPLNDDILAMILSGAQATMDNESYMRFLVTITHVCQGWRSQAFGAPSLWTKFYLDRPALGDLFLKRCAGTGKLLDIACVVRDTDLAAGIDDYTVLKILRPCLDRVGRLELDLRSENEKSLEKASINAISYLGYSELARSDRPLALQLHSLVLRPPAVLTDDGAINRTRRLWCLAHTRLFFNHLPRLRNLDLGFSIFFSPPLGSCQLTRLRITPHTTEVVVAQRLLDILEGSPNLTRIDIEGTPRAVDPPLSLPTIQLPRLRALCMIDTGGALPAIMLQALVTSCRLVSSMTINDYRLLARAYYSQQMQVFPDIEELHLRLGVTGIAICGFSLQGDNAEENGLPEDRRKPILDLVIKSGTTVLGKEIERYDFMRSFPQLVNVRGVVHFSVHQCLVAPSRRHREIWSDILQQMRLLERLELKGPWDVAGALETGLVAVALDTGSDGFFHCPKVTDLNLSILWTDQDGKELLDFPVDVIEELTRLLQKRQGTCAPLNRLSLLHVRGAEMDARSIPAFDSVREYVGEVILVDA